MTADRNDIDFARLRRYLAGESDAAEISAVDVWLAEDPANRDALNSVANGLRIAARLRDERNNVDAAWTRPTPSGSSEPPV